MQICRATFDDQSRILSLYRRVAAVPGGLARLAHEIDGTYVAHFLGNALSRGLCLVCCNDDAEIVAEIHAWRPLPECFSHVLSELTIAVDPDTQGQGIGRLVFTAFLNEIIENRPEVLRVELIARESNAKAIRFYETLGFAVEGRMLGRIRGTAGDLEADIPMAWLRR